MSRPDPIQYAERLYAAIRAANFSPISFLAFGNAVKDGVDLRRMPRIAVEPFMRVVGEMLDFEQQGAEDEIIEASVVTGGTVERSTSVPDPGSTSEMPRSKRSELSDASPTVTPSSPTPVANSPDRRSSE